MRCKSNENVLHVYNLSLLTVPVVSSRMTRGDVALPSVQSWCREERADQMSSHVAIVCMCDGATHTPSELNQLTSQPTAHTENTVQCESINDLGEKNNHNNYDTFCVSVCITISVKVWKIKCHVV